MSRRWRERYDPARHRDHTVRGAGGGLAAAGTETVLCVEVCGFTFRFLSVEQLREYLAFYTDKIHHSSREEPVPHETGHWQRWYERLPLYLQQEPKRRRVVKALEAALREFGNG